MTNAESVSVIEQLFEAAGVKRVVSIDDEYANKSPVEEALALAGQVPELGVAQVFSQYPELQGLEDIDIRNQRIRTVWGNADTNERRRLMYSLRQRSSPEAQPPSEAIDEKMVTVLPELFGKYQLAEVSLGEWLVQKDELLHQGVPLSLILIDENFVKEGRGAHEGLTIVKEVLATGRPELICALLSHNYPPDNIHNDWRALCEKENLDKSRFVLISKSLLTTDPVGFARLLKLAILNGAAQRLKTKASEILHGAEEAAQRRLDAIDIYDLDQIVFRSSYREGVWEPDTLFRVFGLFHREETRKLAKGNADLSSVVEEIRKLSQIPTESNSAPNYNTVDLERLERYEDAEYLNSHFTPIDTGDIFQKTGDSGKRYMLLAQPCDLMVRSDGRRHHTVTEGLLVEIVSGATRDQEGYAELQFLDAGKTEPSFVAFRKIQAVKLNVLDFCAFQPDGQAKFTVGSACPESVIPAWKEHYQKISTDVNAILTRFESLRGLNVTVAEATTIVASCTNEKLLKAVVDLGTRTLTYNLKRVRRLRQPRAAAILSRYANFVARYAFDHDFGEREREEFLKTAIPETLVETSPLIAAGAVDAPEQVGAPSSTVGPLSPETANTPEISSLEHGK